jgi:hypothetical protein
MHAVVAAGYGLWLVGIRSDFSGRYYPEMPPKQPLLVTAAKRPIYLWLMSRNVQVGRAIARRVVPAGAGADSSFAAEMWPGNWTGFEVPPITKPSDLNHDSASSCGSSGAQAALQSFQTKDESAGPVTQIALQPKPGTLWWKMRLPSRPYVDSLDGLTSLITVKGAQPGLTTASGGRVVWSDPKDSSAACVQLTSGPVLWTTTWEITVNTDSLADWSTRDDSVLAQATRTLLLRDLWTNVGQRIRGSGGRIEVPVVRVPR